MTYRQTPWARLIDEQPGEARARILTAFFATDGNTTEAARHLGISHRTLCRYVRRLDLSTAVKKIRGDEQ